MNKFKESNENLIEINPIESEGLYPNPQKLYKEDPIDLSILNRLIGKSVYSVKQFSKELVLELSKFAALLEATQIADSHPLDGKLIISAFFEASTRTRLSFESAVLRLDGKIISIADGKTTGQAKGESIADIGEMFNAYGDLVVMRHPTTEAVDEILQTLRIPLINAGNGLGEHPTQALADWFAILKWRPDLKETVSDKKKIHLGVIGTPSTMRAVKSFVRMSILFKDNIQKMSFISEMADPLGAELLNELKEADIDFEIIHNINNVLNDLDVVYMNSITFVNNTYLSLDQNFKLDETSKLKNSAVVLHPLARLDELSTTLDGTNHNLYFTQAHGAVFIRQALLVSILNRFDRLPNNIPVINNPAK